MKKQKAILNKDFYSADGALHAGEKVIIEHEYIHSAHPPP